MRVAVKQKRMSSSCPLITTSRACTCVALEQPRVAANLGWRKRELENTQRGDLWLFRLFSKCGPEGLDIKKIQETVTPMGCCTVQMTRKGVAWFDKSRGLRRKSNLVTAYNSVTSFGKGIRSTDWKLNPGKDSRCKKRGSLLWWGVCSTSSFYGKVWEKWKAALLLVWASSFHIDSCLCIAVTSPVFLRMQFRACPGSTFSEQQGFIMQLWPCGALPSCLLLVFCWGCQIRQLSTPPAHPVLLLVHLNASGSAKQDLACLVAHLVSLKVASWLSAQVRLQDCPSDKN